MNQNKVLVCTIVLLVGVATAVVSLVARRALRLPVNHTPLTVEETLEIARLQPIDYIPPEIRQKIRRPNPAAKPQLYDILRNGDNESHWGLTVSLFAYIGEEEDVPKIHDVIFAQTGVLDGDRVGGVLGLLQILGAMKARGIKGADAMLQEMVEPSYWDRAPFVMFPTTPEGYMTSSQELAYHSLEAIIYSGDPNASTFGNHLLAGIADPKQRAITKTWVDHALESKRTWKSDLEFAADDR